MVFDIYSYRYRDEMTYVDSVNTQAEAEAEIDRLATEERAKKKRWYHGDPVHFTFFPRGSPPGTRV